MHVHVDQGNQSAVLDGSKILKLVVFFATNFDWNVLLLVDLNIHKISLTLNSQGKFEQLKLVVFFLDSGYYKLCACVWRSREVFKKLEDTNLGMKGPQISSIKMKA